MRHRGRAGDHVELGAVLDVADAAHSQHHDRHDRVGGGSDEEDTPQVVVDDEDALRCSATEAECQGEHVRGDDCATDQGDEQATGREQLLVGYGPEGRPADPTDQNDTEEHHEVGGFRVDEVLVTEDVLSDPVRVRLTGERVVESNRGHRGGATSSPEASLPTALPEQNEGGDERQAGDQMPEGSGTAEHAVQRILQFGSEHEVVDSCRRWVGPRYTARMGLLNYIEYIPRAPLERSLQISFC